MIRTGCAALLVALGVTGCVNAVGAVDDTGATADAKITQLAGALSARFTYPERSGTFEKIRRTLVRGALSPSHVYADTTLWQETVPPATRTILAHGALTDKGYRFEIAPDRSAALGHGDTRHEISLRRIADNEYAWSTTVDFGIGSITAADAGNLLVALFAGNRGHDGAVLRAGLHAAFPRSSAVVGKLFSIDTLSLHPGALGTTLVDAVFTIHPDSLRPELPHLADYVARYVSSGRYRFSLADHAGTIYMTGRAGDGRLSFHYRVKDGSLVSELGPPRVLPDTLRLTTDLTMHVKMFDVGWKQLQADMVIRRGEHLRAWLFRFQEEPDWQLPLITERLIRSPLHRPFTGEGASFEIGVIDSAGAQTNLFRHAHLEIRESTIFRFLGGLVARMFDDMDTAMEREEAAYVREVMQAFAQDSHASLAK